MGYGKIDLESGYLMSTQVKHDNTWSPLEEFQKDENGNFAEYYNLDKTIDTTIILENEILKVNNATIELIDNTIQAEIDLYNEANGIALSSVHNAESYSRVPGYTHQVFCESVWLWSVSLWEHMRTWQGTLVTVPTMAEVQIKIDELPFQEIE